MTQRIIFQGFRHNHIHDLYQRAASHQTLRIVGSSESNEAARSEAVARNVSITHDNFDEMLESIPCDIVAIADFYSARGADVIKALRRGKDVICDKPLCTSIAEFETIEAIVREKKRSVFCMLDLRDWGHFRAMREAVREGLLGSVTAASFGGQHELKYGQRPEWYFQKGKHGGTLNDLAIHGIDLVQWVTGLRFSALHAARAWNARLPEAPHFQDGAQLMAELENRAGVIGDVSYFLPEGQTAASPHYWRVTIWGTKGVIETSFGDRAVRFWETGKSAARELASGNDTPGNYLEAFLREIAGESRPEDLTTADSLAATRVALLAQGLADCGGATVDVLNSSSERNVPVPPG